MFAVKELFLEEIEYKPLENLSDIIVENTNASPEDFKKALDSWLAGAQRIIDTYNAKMGFKDVEKLSITVGKAYYKIASKSVHAFISKNGDVLKPASWKAPAKGARGNIFDEHNGLGRMGPYGPGYNK